MPSWWTFLNQHKSGVLPLRSTMWSGCRARLASWMCIRHPQTQTAVVFLAVSVLFAVPSSPHPPAARRSPPVDPGTECASVSSDGRLLFWDVRKLNEVRRRRRSPLRTPPSPEGKDGGAMEWSECFSGAFSGLNRWTREKSWISLHWM